LFDRSSIPEITMSAFQQLWLTIQRNGGKNSPSDSDAEFIGWQKTMTGEKPALFTVKAKQHPLYGSTVSETTLRQQNLENPHTPPAQSPLKGLGYEK
jgi:hypothetical protein